jgi:hypothetical protein
MILFIRFLFGTALALIPFGSTSVSAQSRTAAAVAQPLASAPAAREFSAFRAIADRNIFDASRVDRVERSTNPSAPAPTPPAAQTITLVGTMDYEKGRFAFFDSSESAYRRVLEVDESLGGFTLTAITDASVELRDDNRSVTLQLRQQLRRTADSAWIVTDAPVSPSSATPSPASRSTAPAQPSIPADASETLRRLMEKRLKKTQKP